MFIIFSHAEAEGVGGGGFCGLQWGDGRNPLNPKSIGSEMLREGTLLMKALRFGSGYIF